MVEAKLCKGLTIENVATRFVLGEQAEADQLKECCLELIKPNAAAVMATEGWADVASNNALVNEVLAFLAGATTHNKGEGKKRTADEAELSTPAQDEEVEQMRGWKVARLREELQRRGLDTKGRKGELVERLERAMKGGSDGGSSSSSSGLGAAQ